MFMNESVYLIQQALETDGLAPRAEARGLIVHYKDKEGHDNLQALPMEIAISITFNQMVDPRPHMAGTKIGNTETSGVAVLYIRKSHRWIAVNDEAVWYGDRTGFTSIPCRPLDEAWDLDEEALAKVVKTVKDNLWRLRI